MFKTKQAHKLGFIFMASVTISACFKQNDAIGEIEVENKSNPPLIKNTSSYEIIKTTFLCEYFKTEPTYSAADATAAAADATAAAADAAAPASEASAAIDLEVDNIGISSKNLDKTEIISISYTLEPGSFRKAEVDYKPCIRVEIKGARYLEDKFLDNQ